MLNKATIIGNLGADPEVRFMPSGDQITNLSVATTRKWKDKAGEAQSETEWHRVTIFGKLAKVASDYLHKGSKVYLEGRIKTTKWEKEGVDHYSTGIIADTMFMLDGKQDGQSSADTTQPAQNTRSPSQPAPDNFADFDSDIPF